MSATGSDGPVSMAWTDETDPPILECSDEVVAGKIERLVERKRRIGNVLVSFESPSKAFATMVAGLRAYAGVHGLIDVTILDDDGEELPFVPT